MRKQILFLIFLSLYGLQVHSQSSQNTDAKNPIDDFVVETPDITAFHKNNFMPIDLHSGKVNVDIPFYNIKCGNIEVPIQLQYNTSGNKVEDLASNVGLGWNLQAGGSIMHIVQDLPDDDLYIKAYTEPLPVQADYYEVTTIGYHRRVYDYDDTVDEVGEPLPNGRKYQRRFANFIDSSPDFYHVAAPNLNAKFIVLSDDPIENNTIIKGKQNLFSRSFKAKVLDDQGIKIDDSELKYAVFDTLNILNKEYTDSSFAPGTYPRPEKWQEYHEAKYLKSFKIINSNGLIYEFKVGNVVETDGYFSGFGLGNREYKKRVTSWDLHSITDPITDKKVIFEYEVYQQTNVEKIPSLGLKNMSQWGPIYRFIPLSGPIHTHSKKVHPRVTRLTKIRFDKGSVEFKYGFNRQDYSDKALSEIMIRDNRQKKIKGYRLIYDYFHSKESNCNKQECKRLKLTEVRVVDREEDTEDQAVLKRHKFEYYESEKLPSRKYSLEQDYLGYYNKNGAGAFSPDMIDPSAGSFEYVLMSKYPILYYYPDQKELSILPFKKQNITDSNKYAKFPREQYGFTLEGYSLEPVLEGNRATSLKKITYPAGGSLELTYENHEFYFEGHNYKAPGLRIRKQILNDGKGNIQEREYQYLTENNTSSGSFNNIPVFAYPDRPFDTQGSIPSGNNFNLEGFIKPKSGLELTNGSFIGYSMVKEFFPGNGYKLYKYTSPKEHPNLRSVRKVNHSPIQFENKFLMDNSAFPGTLYTNNDMKRGKLLLEEVYAENSSLKTRTTYKYQYKKYDSVATRYIGDFNFTTCNRKRFATYVDFKKEISQSYGCGARIFEEANIFIERNLNTEIKREEFYPSGIAEETESISYHENYPFPRSKEINYGSGLIQKTEWKYPIDFNSPEMNALTQLHIIDEPVEYKNIINQSFTTTKRNFSLINSKPYLSSLSKSKQNESDVTAVNFDKYDLLTGKIIQFTETNGISTVIIWGYNKTVPIARIENATQSQVENAISNLALNYNTIEKIQGLSDADVDRTIGNSGTEGILRTALNAIRNALPSAQVKSYTYDSLVGVTSITDEKGITSYYEYDKYNRLIQIKDYEGNILSETQYNYKN